MERNSTKNKLHQGTTTRSLQSITHKPYIKYIAWINVVFQFLFPLSLSFTPTIAAATKQQVVMPTPLAATTASLPTLAETDTINREKDAMLAGHLSTAGTLLANDNPSSAAANLARSTAANTASQSIQQWLRPFGTAKVQLNLDKEFKLHGSAVDVLVPLYDRQKSLLFTQFGIRNKDGRNTLNIGTGVRVNYGDWMYGLNTFFDNDITGNNRRVGVGVEAWRDYLKFSANQYVGITNWHQARKLVDYHERPANGYDVRAESFLPAYPQLGGSLMYEKYFGKEVALFNPDKRYKNPQAMTMGVNYTPIPLITFNVDQRWGNGGQKESRIGLQLNYRLGDSWQSQIDPQAVAVARSLAGSRYDLVERNNNIVLEYQKKELIHLNTLGKIQGYAGEQKSLGVSVTTKYKLERIEWDAAPLLAKGGKIIPEAIDRYAVLLPHYQYGDNAQNTYTIHAIAYDTKGNTSRRVPTEITVTQAAISVNNSTFTPAESTLPADGKSTQVLTLAVRDKNNLPVNIQENEISLNTKSNLSDETSVQISPFKRTAAGQYVTTVTAGTKPETIILTPAARHMALPAAKVTLVADKKTAQIAEGNLTVVENNATADDNEQNRVKVVLTDAQGNRVPQHPIYFTADNQATIAANGTTDKNGELLMTLTSKIAGESQVTAQVGSTENAKVKVSFVANHRTARIIQGDLIISQNDAIANGVDTNAVQAKVTDEQGNPVPGQKVTFVAYNERVEITHPQQITDAQGLAATTLTSTAAGLIGVTASVNAKRKKDKKQRVEVNFEGDVSSALVREVNVSVKDGIVADGHTPATYFAVIEDKSGNRLANQKVFWNHDGGVEIRLSAGQSVSNYKGIAQIKATSKQAGSVIVSAQIPNSLKSARAVTFIADDKTATLHSLQADKTNIIANNQDTTRITATVVDAQGNRAPNIAVQWSSDVKANITALHPTTDKNGQVHAKVTTTQAGVVTIIATLQNGSTQQARVNARADATTATVVTLTSARDTAPADDSETIIFFAKVEDANGNAVSNLSVSWSTNLNQFEDKTNHTTRQTNLQGIAQIALRGIQAGNAEVTAVLPNNSERKTVTFTPLNAIHHGSTFSVTPQAITADGRTKAIAIVLLKDKHGNRVPGQTIAYSAENHEITFKNQTEKGNGFYAVEVVGKIEGTHDLKANINNDAELKTQLGFVADYETAQLVMVTVDDPPKAQANGKDTVTISALVRDKNSNELLEGVAVGWQTSLGDFAQPISTTNGKGEATIKLSSQQAGLATVTAILGNGSEQVADQQITFLAGVVDPSTSTLTATPTQIIADGIDETRVRIMAKDEHSNSLSGLANAIKLNFKGNPLTIKGAFEEVSSGVYQAKVSGKKAGQSIISATINGKAINQQVLLTLIADNRTAKVKGHITVDHNAAITGEKVTYSATLVDANDNPLGAGLPVTWQANMGSQFDQSQTITDKNGKITAILTRNTAGKATVALILSQGQVQAPDVQFTAGLIDSKNSSLTLRPQSITADGLDVATLEVILRDQYGNPVNKQRVIAESPHKDIQIESAIENHPGVYTLAVKGTVAGQASLVVKVNNVAFKSPQTLTLKGDFRSWKIDVTANKQEMIAGDKSGVVYTTRVLDKYNNPLENAVVSWQLPPGANPATFDPVSYTDKKGEAISILTSTVAGEVKMKAYLDPSQFKQAPSVTIKAGEVDPESSTFTSDKTQIGAGHTESAQLTVQLRDRYKNRVLGKTVTITQSKPKLADVNIESPQENQGDYKATVTAQHEGKLALVATVDGKEIGQAISITVGTITPPLRFDNKHMKVTHTHDFRESQQLYGAPKEVSVVWSSKNEKIATVDQNGKVTLHASGTTRITALSSPKEQYGIGSAAYELNVMKAEPRLKFAAGRNNMIYGESFTLPTLSSELNTTDFSHLELVWSSSDPTIVTVDQKGQIKALKAGEVRIKVGTQETTTTTSSQAEYPLTVNLADPKLTFSKENLDITFGDSLQPPTLSLGNKNFDINGLSRTWVSSDPRTVSVDQNGKVTVKKAGTVTVTVTAAATEQTTESRATYSLTVKKSVSSLTFQTKVYRITYGNTFQGPQPTRSVNITSNKLSWSSDNTGIASVDQNGKVTVKKAGTATITVMAAATEQTTESRVTYSLTVDKAASNLTFGTTAYSITYGDVFQGPKPTQSGNITTSLSWSSDNTSIANVDKSGKVTVNKAGTVKVTVKAAETSSIKGAEASYKLTIEPAKIKMESSLYFKLTTLFGYTFGQSTRVGSRFTEPPLLSYNSEININDLSLTWKTSDPSIAEVDNNGKITAHKAGVVTVTVKAQETATIKSSEAEYTLTVQEKYTPSGGGGGKRCIEVNGGMSGNICFPS